MRKIIFWVSLFLFIGSTLFLGNGWIKSKQEIQQKNKKIEQLTIQRQTLKKENHSVTVKFKEEKETMEENEKKVKEAETIKNNDSTSETRKCFVRHVEQLFKEMYTFSPNTYGERKEKVKELLSKELQEKWFSDQTTMGDSNGVSSNLISCEVYPKAVNDQLIQALVVAKYSSSSFESETQKAMNLFAVTYDPQGQQVTDLQNLGSGYTGDLLE